MGNSPQHWHRGLTSQVMHVQGTRSTIIKSILCYGTVGDAWMAIIIVANPRSLEPNPQPYRVVTVAPVLDMPRGQRWVVLFVMGLPSFLEDIDVRYEFVRHLLYYPISILALGNLSPFLDLTRQHCTGEIPSRRSSVCKYARLFKTSLPGIARFKTNLYWTVYHHEEARQQLSGRSARTIQYASSVQYHRVLKGTALIEKRGRFFAKGRGE